MRKMKILLVLALACALMACGSKEKENQDNKSKERIVETDTEENEIEENSNEEDAIAHFIEEEEEIVIPVVKKEQVVSVTDRIYNTEYVYDMNGTLLRSITGTLQNTNLVRCEYDKNGNKILQWELIDSWTYGGASNNIHMWDYDDAGRCIAYYVFDDESTAMQLIKSWVYDNEGRELEENEYYSDGEPMTQTIYEYDEMGRRIKKTQKYDGELKYWTEYLYTEEGFLTSEVNYDENGETGSWVDYIEWRDDEYDAVQEIHYHNGDQFMYGNRQTYDENGRLIKKYELKEVYGSEHLTAELTDYYEYDEDGNLLRESIKGEEIVYEYDWALNRVKKSLYNRDGNLIEWCTYEIGNEEEAKEPYDYASYYDDGTVSDMSAHEYDSQGRVIAEYTDLNYTRNYQYDDGGKLVSIEFDDGKQKNLSAIEYDTADNRIKYGENGQWEYDNYNNLVKEVMTDGTYYEYRYDKYGNVTKRIKYSSKGEVWNTSIWNYNEEGLIISAEYYERDELVESIKIR